MFAWGAQPLAPAADLVTCQRSLSILPVTSFLRSVSTADGLRVFGYLVGASRWDTVFVRLLMAAAHSSASCFMWLSETLFVDTRTLGF